VSIAVDLSVAGPDQTTLVFTATGVLTGAGTADQHVPEDKTQAVLAAFTTALPGLKLPFDIAPTSEGARGSDVIIKGIADFETNAIVLKRIGRVYAVKYEGKEEAADDSTPDSPNEEETPAGGMYVVRPQTAYAWQQFPSDATRWRFESEK
jgi:hypothetical protein